MASVSVVRTWFLAPTYDFGPESIHLGDIIKDPTDPANHISRLAKGKRVHPSGSTEEKLVHPSNSTENDHKLNLGRDQGLWAIFLKTVLGFAVEARTTENTYSVKALETIWYDPEPKKLQERLEEPNVRAAFKGVPGKRRRVYIITGLKIAKGKRRIASSKGELNRGAEDTGAESSEKAPEASDKIFAYQLETLELKGFWQKRLQVRPYSKGAMF